MQTYSMREIMLEQMRYKNCTRTKIRSKIVHFYRVMLCGLCRRKMYVCPFVCPFLRSSVTRRYSAETVKHILKHFATGSHAILVFKRLTLL